MAKSEENIFFKEIEVQIGTNTYTVTPMSWKSEFKVIRTLSGLIKEVMKLSGEESGIDEIKKSPLDYISDCLLEEHIEDIAVALHLATGIEQETIDAMNIDEMLELTTAVIRVNADFFVKALARFQNLKAQVQ